MECLENVYENYCYLQHPLIFQTRAPLQPERIADIMERTKEYGVLFGKGGRFGQVRFQKCLP